MKFAIYLMCIPLLWLGTSCTAQENNASNIDGRTFFITSYMPDGSKSEDEYIYFKEGTLEGSECSKYGYDQPKYTVSDDGKIEATMQSSEQGTLKWEGQIKNGVFTGTSYWKKEGQEDIRFTFKGSEVKE